MPDAIPHPPWRFESIQYGRGLHPWGINDTINYIKTIWKWGLGRQLVKIENVQSLEEVKPLLAGQENVHENHKRRRVTEEDFNKVVDAVSPVIGDMLKLVWYTAMRPYEVCDMKPCDILKDDRDCWIYIPGRTESPYGNHKTTRFERVRVIPDRNSRLLRCLPSP